MVTGCATAGHCGFAHAITLKRHGGSACCSSTFGHCFHKISSVAQRTYITQHAFSDPKYLLRFLIPYKYILNCYDKNVMQTLTSPKDKIPVCHPTGQHCNS